MGWTWGEAENELTVPRLDAMLRHWEREPPGDVLLDWITRSFGRTPAPVHGEKPGPLKLIADRPPEGLGALRAAFPRGVVRAG